MSLENEVSALTAAVNTLTATYDGKIGEIDAAVAGMRSDVDGYIAAGLVRSVNYYVDAVGGDDANDGSADAPFKTVDRAFGGVKTGDRAFILLAGDQTHVFNIPRKMQAAHTAMITFRRWGGTEPLTLLEWKAPLGAPGWYITFSDDYPFRLKFIAETGHPLPRINVRITSILNTAVYLENPGAHAPYGVVGGAYGPAILSLYNTAVYQTDADLKLLDVQGWFGCLRAQIVTLSGSAAPNSYADIVNGIVWEEAGQARNLLSNATLV